MKRTSGLDNLGFLAKLISQDDLAFMKPIELWSRLY